MASFHSLDLQFEGSMYIGIILSAVIYGVYLTLYFVSVRVFMTSAQTTRSRRIFYISFGGVLVFLNTIVFASMPLLGQLMWIVHRNEVDPLVYFEDNSIKAWYVIASSLAQTVANFLTDALLIYRCYVVFESRIWIILVPTLCSIAFLVLSIAENLIPANELLLLSRISLSAVGLTMAVNIMVTAMISIKILLVARRARKHADLYMTQPYTSIVAILIESAAPWTILGIFVIVVGAIKSIEWGLAVSLTWLGIGALTPQLIILRIAMGFAWNKRTSLELSQLGTIAFAPRPSPEIRRSRGLRSPPLSDHQDIVSVFRTQNNIQDIEAGLPEKSRNSLTSSVISV